jgi:hypothetical protein
VLEKIIPLHESLQLELRAEAFHAVINHFSSAVTVTANSNNAIPPAAWDIL